MADQSDVETALATLAAAALYPAGPEAVSVPGPPCRIYRGWPNPAALDADLARGHVNVSIFIGDANQRVTTRFAEEWMSTPISPTLLVSVADTTVIFNGSADPGQLAGILIDGQSYVYRTQVNDTPPLVAATLGTLIRAVRIVHLRGASLDIPGAASLHARVVADCPALKEIRRQSVPIRITCWCPSPATRDAAAIAIDTAFATLPFINLADGSQARLTFSGNAVIDQSQNASLYRRDLVYVAEYATTLVQSHPSMLFGELGLNASHIAV